jgi:hypothetical protein
VTGDGRLVTGDSRTRDDRPRGDTAGSIGCSEDALVDVFGSLRQNF